MQKYSNPYVGLSLEYPPDLEQNEVEPVHGTYVLNFGSASMDGGVTLTMSPEAEGTVESMQGTIVDRLRMTTSSQLQCRVDVDTSADVADCTFGDAVKGKEFLMKSEAMVVPGPTGMPTSVQLLFWNAYTILNEYVYIIQVVASNPNVLEEMLAVVRAMMATMRFEEPNPKVEAVCATIWKEHFIEDVKLSLFYPIDWKLAGHALGSAGALGDAWEAAEEGVSATKPCANRVLEMKWNSGDKHQHQLCGIVVLEELPPYTTLEEYSRLCKVQLEKALVPLLTVSSRQKSLAGHEGKEYSFSPKATVKVTRRHTVLEADNKALIFAFEATNSAELAPEPVFECIMNSATLHDEEWVRKIPRGFVRYEHFVMKLSVMFPEDFEYKGDVSMGFSVTSAKHPGLEFSVTAIKRDITDSLDDMLQALDAHYMQMGNAKMYSENATVGGVDGRELMHTGRSMQMDGTLGEPEQRMTRAAQHKGAVYLLTFAARIEEFAAIWNEYGKSMMESFLLTDL